MKDVRHRVRTVAKQHQSLREEHIMSHRKTSTLKIMAALALSAVGVAGAESVNVSFTNRAPTGVVDVYVDGVRTFSNMFGGNSSFFPVSVPAGKHQVVVTRVGQAPGSANLMQADMDLRYAQVWTFKTDNANFQTYKISVAPSGE